MNIASFIEKLLDGVEVEWLPLGDVSEIKRGTSITKRNINEGSIPVIAGGRTPAYYHNVSNRDGQTIVIAGSGAYAGFVSWWEQPIFVSDAFTIKTNKILIAKYCYHFLLNMQQQLYNLKSGGGVPHVYPRNVAPIKIPIPCPDNPEKSLAIQAEITRILDSFTELTAELTAELTTREKQYNYYRDLLLSEEELSKVGFEWKTLGDVVTLQRGRRLVRSQLEESGDYAVYQNSMTPLGYYHESNVEGGTTFVVCAGAAGEVGYSSSAFWAADDVHFCIVPDNIINKYVFYFLCTQQNKILSQVRRSSVPRLSKAVLEKLQIPIPPFAEQARIVAILDKFDTLTKSIIEGLPREIELRQQQYEYYRDLLLSFPKSSDEQVA